MVSRRRFLQAGTITAGASLAAFSPSLRAEEACAALAHAVDQGKLGDIVRLMIGDVANYDRNSTEFPFLRNFDVYAGHSWADGAANHLGHLHGQLVSGLLWDLRKSGAVLATDFDGREVSRAVSKFKGTPERPLDQAELREKFLLLTRHLDRSKMEATFERLQRIESEKTLDWVKV
jgi:hypothetical protein